LDRQSGCIGYSILCQFGPAQFLAWGYEIVLLKPQTLSSKHIASGVMSHKPDVEIRAPRDDDWVVDGVPLPRPGDDTWQRTRVAIADGQVVGSASLMLAPVTDWYFCEVTVVPEYRRRSLGTRLYAAVYELTDRSIPVVTRAMNSQPIRRRFAESIGCSTLVHCPEPWIDPTSTAGQEWITQQQLPDGYQTVSMDELPIERVERAWSTYFEWAHRPFGTVHTDQLPQYWTQYSDGLDPDASRLSIETSTGAIVVLSLVTPDAWDGRTMIVSETVHEEQRHGDQLLGATIAASLGRLADQGIRRVELEGHSTDAHSPQIVQTIPAGGGDPMDILKLAPPHRGSAHEAARPAAQRGHAPSAERSEAP
jgi:GNAT superfamily N-acetyltransferase